MAIIFNEKNKTFHLQGQNVSYIMEIYPTGHLLHNFWGGKIEKSDGFELSTFNLDAAYTAMQVGEEELSLELLPVEYPAHGNADLRTPAFDLEYSDGGRISDFRYVRHTITSGKAAIKGLPSLYTNEGQTVDTLEIVLKDEVKKLEMTLFYSIFEAEDIVTRRVELKNLGTEKVIIKELSSACVELPHHEFDMIQMSGSWGRERHVQRNSIVPGGQYIDSSRGHSGHEHSPFLALAATDATDSYGEVYGMSLVYSGNFKAGINVDMRYNTRMQIGINPFRFSWNLEPNETFSAPEAVLVYSAEGTGGMSKKYRDIYQSNLIKPDYKYQERPILINSWEAFYFDLKEEELGEFAKTSSELGMELFVMDDGWFGKRDNDQTSLGDWFIHEGKFPNGLKDLSNKVKDLGMKFGIWVEPEMISPKSELFSKHPDWCIETKDRVKSLSRNQYVLDLTKPEVREYIISAMRKVFTETGTDYIKWDMNRSITEAGSSSVDANQQGEVSHRYILGLYEILEVLTNEFPNILFESCAGGGGRYDAGMLYYMPQTWTSDDTDAIERLFIQEGTLYQFPNISMGSHVSACPNHQVGRTTPISTRGVVAMQGNLGYELNVLELTDAEKEEVKEQTALYKKIRGTVQLGDFTHLKVNDSTNARAWQHLSKDKNQVVASYVQILARANVAPKKIKLVDLEGTARYQLDGTDSIYYGDELMNFGLTTVRIEKDFESQQWVFNKLAD